MAIYRVKQFYWAITSPFRKVDKDYIEKHLTKEEMRLFYRLTKGEILHCVRVARAAGLYYDELIEEGYLKNKGRLNKKKKETAGYMHFISDDGYDIYVGKNNKQND